MTAKPRKHNHVTRDIKSLGECPSCDLHHVKSWLRVKLTELSSCCLDDDADFKKVLDQMTLTTIELVDLDRRSRA